MHACMKQGCIPVILALGTLTQDDSKSQAYLGYVGHLVSNHQDNLSKKTEQNETIQYKNKKNHKIKKSGFLSTFMGLPPPHIISLHTTYYKWSC